MQTTNYFDYKPGHMYINCSELFDNWDDVMKYALEISCDKYEDEDKPELKLPRTKHELKE